MAEPLADFPDMRRREPEALARIFRYYGEFETPRLDSAVYTTLAFGIADDPELLALAQRVDPGQPAPNVFWGAVQMLLMLDAEAGRPAHPLARWYPAVSGGEPIPDASPVEAFRSFCLDEEARLTPWLRKGRTQTCVVHRSAALLPAIGSLPAIGAHGGRAALLEIGPSVGLNLRLDRYGYVYHRDGSHRNGSTHGDGRTTAPGPQSLDGPAARAGSARQWGSPEARPQLVVEDRSAIALPLPERLEVVARRGLELNPIDLDDPDAVRWLRALIWPEHVGRARAMDEALELASSVPIEIVAGDATVDIEREAEKLPTDAARVVFATHVFYQIPKVGRRKVLEGLARASESAPIDFILMDSSGEGDSIVSRFGFEAGERRVRETLARVDSHGRWIVWQER